MFVCGPRIELSVRLTNYRANDNSNDLNNLSLAYAVVHSFHPRRCCVDNDTRNSIHPSAAFLQNMLVITAPLLYHSQVLIRM